ncbi:MAG: dockerin type I repeat-containing protein, partial [Armatimonadetes bacterium]|nr:dockerin type I repeat-containing protein [Armatimonadota bacterium]
MTSIRTHLLFIGLLTAVSIPSPARAQTPAAFLPPGDLTGDLQVTIHDAIQVMRFLAGMRTLVGAENAAADVAPASSPGRLWGNGRVTVEDAVRLLRRSVGLEPDPWPGGPVTPPSTNGLRLTVSPSGSPYRLTVANGVQVTGFVRDERGKPFSGVLYYWNSARRLLGQVTPDTEGKFAFHAPQGIYEFSTLTRHIDATTGAVVEIPHAGIHTLSVAPGMPSILIARPALPALRTVKVRLTNVPMGFTPVRVEFLDLERQFEFAPPPALGRSSAIKDGVFTLLVPNGNYKPLVVLNRKDEKGNVIGTVAALPAQSVGVFQNRDSTFGVPPLGSLSGTFSMTGVSSPSGRVFAQTVLDTQNGGGAEGG